MDLESLSADLGADVESLVRQPEDVASYRREHTLGFILPSSTTSWSLRQAREFFTYGGTVSIISLSFAVYLPLARTYLYSSCSILHFLRFLTRL